MSKKQTIQSGSKVELEYTLALEDGTVVDQADVNDPMQLTIGKGDVIEGLEQALIGLTTGEEAKLQLTPEQGFGLPDESAIQWMERDQFPESIELKVNQIIGFTMPDDSEVPGAIKKIEETRVLVDLNHPLAGHTITFRVNILKVID